jgi:hypothetical protein
VPVNVLAPGYVMKLEILVREAGGSLTAVETCVAVR